MNYLVGDIGNTLIKFSILNEKFRIKKIYNIETKKILINSTKNKILKKILRKKN